jgi:ADP-ribose pyrophosphatase
VIPRLLDAKTVYQARNWRVEEQLLELENGKPFQFATIEHPGAVVILPLPSPGRILLLHQYRQSLRKFIFELPAGTLGKGEAPLACAEREIREETGYRARHWKELGILHPLPGFCFVASELTPDPANADEDEVIEVREYSIAEIDNLILRGDITDTKTLALLFKARLQGLI